MQTNKLIPDNIVEQIIKNHIHDRSVITGNQAKWASVCLENLDYIHKICKEYNFPNKQNIKHQSIPFDIIEYCAWIAFQHGDANLKSLEYLVHSDEDFNYEEKDNKVLHKKDKQYTYLSNKYFEKRDFTTEQLEHIIIQKQIAGLLSMKIAGAKPVMQAYLTDRIHRNEGREQVFGTQVVPHYNPKKAKQIPDHDPQYRSTEDSKIIQKWNNNREKIGFFDTYYQTRLTTILPNSFGKICKEYASGLIDPFKITQPCSLGK